MCTETGREGFQLKGGIKMTYIQILMSWLIFNELVIVYFLQVASVRA